MTSWMLAAERLAMRYLPTNLTRSLQDLKQRLPLRLDQAPPIVQMYVDDDHTRSYLGFNNFYSCLVADLDTPTAVTLRFYAASGELVLTHARSLAHCGADAVDVHALLAAAGVRSPFGVVTVQITPRAPRRAAYRELGQVSAQFFMFFRDRAAGSLGQTHPLSTAQPDQPPSPPFCSSQIISTAQLRELVVFQYNPTARAHTLEHQLVDADTGATVAAQRATVPARGSVRTAFAIAGLPARLMFQVDALPSPNSKPMLRRVFASGQHSISHA